MSKFCGSCGSKLSENAKFCQKCGNKIEVKTTESSKKTTKKVQPKQKAQENIQVQAHPDANLANKPFVDIFVDGELHLTKQMTQDVFYKYGFHVEWYNEHSGRAKKGNVGLTIAFGSIAQAYTIDFQVFTMPDGGSGVRLFKTSSGWSGGAWGSVKTQRKYYEIVGMLSNDFNERGLYKGRFPE